MTKRPMHKWLAGLLVVAMFFSFVPTAFAAQEKDVYKRQSQVFLRQIA